VAEAAAQRLAGVDDADQRGVHGHDAAGPQTLQRAGNEQTWQRPGQRAAERRQREQHEAAEIDALMADDLAERAERQQGRDQCDLVDVDHPDRFGRADVEVGRDRRQRDVRNRRIERGHRQRGEDRRDRPAPLTRGQPARAAVSGRELRSVLAV